MICPKRGRSGFVKRKKAHHVRFPSVPVHFKVLDRYTMKGLDVAYLHAIVMPAEMLGAWWSRPLAFPPVKGCPTYHVLPRDFSVSPLASITQR